MFSPIILSIIYTISVIIIALTGIRIISYILNHLKRFNNNLTLIYALRDVFKYSIYIIAITIILNIFGVDVRGIFVSIGIVGIAVGFAAKDIISNFMSGFFLISDKSLRVGDTMKINNIKGEIQKIGFRTTTLKDESGIIITIPNSTLSTTPYQKFKKYERLKCEINVILPFNIAIDIFTQYIIEFIKNTDGIKTTPEVEVESKEINESGAKIVVRFWVESFNKKENHKLNITTEIQKYIDKNK